MGNMPSNSAVEKAATQEFHFRSMNVAMRHAVTDRRPLTEARAVRATIVFPDATVAHVMLMGDDSERFNTIKDHLHHGSVTAISISDQDGPAAVGWLDADALDRGLTPNRIASALVDRLIVGPMVITGPGKDEDESMASIHEGLRLVIDRMARDASRDKGGGD
jgi:hypothetical protein